MNFFSIVTGAMSSDETLKIEPTLTAGVQAMTTAALTWLGSL